MINELFVVILFLFLISILVDVWVSISKYFVINSREHPKTTDGTNLRTIQPYSISLKHSLLFVFQKFNYKIHFILCLLHITLLRFKSTPITTNHVVNFLINTSMIMFATNKVTEKGIFITFSMSGFRFPVIPKAVDNSIFVECFIPIENDCAADKSSKLNYVMNNLEGCKMISFNFCGNEIDNPTEQLTILSTVTATTFHPIIHSFFSRVYDKKDDPVLEDYPEFFYHGQYLNEVSFEYPGDCYGFGREIFKELLAANSQMDIPFHVGHLMKIRGYSRFVRFLFRARSILHKIGTNQGIHKAISMEDLFITSILHSTDHVMTGQLLKPHFLENFTLENRSWFNLLSALFYAPCGQYIFSNLLCDLKNKNLMYTNLHDELVEIDSHLASHVTFSISY